MSAEQWQIMRDTGTVHLMAISGLHIGLFALMGFYLGALLLRLLQCIRANWYCHWLPSVFSILFAVIYSALAGLSLPTQRALIMVVVVHAFVCLKRRCSPWFVLSVALCLIALLDPLAVHGSGFWLSFVAVSVLLYVFVGKIQPISQRSSSAFQVKIIGCFRDILRSQWAVAVGLLLPGIVFIQGVSLVAPIANAFAVPWVSMVTVPLLLLALMGWQVNTGFTTLTLEWADTSLTVLFAVLEWMTQIPVAFWHFDRGEISWWALGLAILGCAYTLAPKGFPCRYLGLCTCLPLFFPQQTPQPLMLTVFDVGQGMAIAIETPNHQMVYDLGRRFSERFDVGEHIVAPYLLRRGLDSIDRLYLSHGDGDHAGGLDGLLSRIAARELFSGESHKTGGQPCHKGQSWLWDGVSFEVLWPDQEFGAPAPSLMKSNNRSCVIRIRYQQHTLILSGDIEAKVERRLLQQDLLSSATVSPLSALPLSALPITVLLVPHHGSLTSSHPQWVRQLKPKHAVISAGYNNHYGHPNPVILQRYQGVHSQVHQTAQHGAVQFIFDRQGGYDVTHWRQHRARYWFD